MSKEFNVTMSQNYSSAIGKKAPVAHPQNCSNTDCPYGRGRTFCFPCMARIMAEHKATKTGYKKDV